MLAYLLEKHTTENVIITLNLLSEIIGIAEFQRLFSVILTDRGQNSVILTLLNVIQMVRSRLRFFTVILIAHDRKAR